MATDAPSEFEVNGIALGVKERDEGVPPCYVHVGERLVCDDAGWIRPVFDAERAFALGYIKGYTSVGEEVS
jgi:hypothetical protein